MWNRRTFLRLGSVGAVGTAAFAARPAAGMDVIEAASAAVADRTPEDVAQDEFYWREIQESLKAAPNMKGRKSTSSDADIMWYGIDRVVHTKTGGGHEKVDTYKDLDEALGRFQALRATMIEYIKTTKDDMRAHSFGDSKDVIDCWQWMLEISTHAERHIQQIREIKNDPKFPKK
jgi:hypothetical protein